MLSIVFVALTPLIIVALAQQRGTVTSEEHPLLTTYKCTKSGGCVAQQSKLVLDANLRWLHGPGPALSPCYNYSASTWDPKICPDPTTCAQNCAFEGVSQASYTSTYGVATSGNTLTQVMYPQSGNAGSLLYLLSDDNHYQLFKLRGQEITFDVDVSKLPCGMNGALYLVSMDADGGQSTYINNKAGAYLGTGYCDAQCPNYGLFNRGQANFRTTNGQGRYGSCCHEMDIWEANTISTDMTPHPCNRTGQYSCDTSSSTDCKVCDGVGCDFNPYRMGNTSFYGPGKTVPTDPGVIRVITQFITSDRTPTGQLTEIRRMYIRGSLIWNSQSLVPGLSGNSISDTFCTQQSNVFNPPPAFANYGGMNSMAGALDRGMVLAFSLWVDPAGHMRTLDGKYPSAGTGPGVFRGSCPDSAGDPSNLRTQYPNAQVQFSNIKYGELDSTYGTPWP